VRLLRPAHTQLNHTKIRIDA